MARTTFGGTLADYVVLPESGVYRRPGSVEVTVWDAQTGGTQLTDILLLDGTPVTSLRTGGEGLIPAFQGPDGVKEAWYQVAGASQRYRIAVGQVGPEGPEGPMGDVTPEAIAARDAAQTAKTQAETARSEAQVAASVATTNQEAWRREYVDRLTRIAAVEDRPAVAITQQGTSTIADPSALLRLLRQGDGSNSQPADLVNDTRFLTDGTPGLDVISASNSYVTAPLLPGGTAQNAAYLVRHETYTDPANKVIEFKVRPPATSLGYRLWVDGRPTTLTTVQFSGLSAGSGHVLKFTFPTARARRIGLEFPARVGIDGAYVPNGQGLTRPTYTVQLRQAYLGDSFLGGTGTPPTGAGRGDTWGPLLGLLCAAESRWAFGIGGTGWSTTNPFSDRVSALLASNPHEVYILGSRDDGNTDVSAAVSSVLSSLASVPRVFVIGPTESAYPVLTASLKSATEAAGRTFIDPAGEAWIRNNPSKYLISGDIHPNYAGQTRIAAGIYEGRARASAV